MSVFVSSRTRRQCDAKNRGFDTRNVSIHLFLSLFADQSKALPMVGGKGCRAHLMTSQMSGHAEIFDHTIGLFTSKQKSMRLYLVYLANAIHVASPIEIGVFVHSDEITHG